MGYLEVEVSAEQLKTLKRLAEDHYGDSDEAAMGEVVEAALAMRLKWLEVGGPVAEESRRAGSRLGDQRWIRCDATRPGNVGVDV